MMLGMGEMMCSARIHSRQLLLWVLCQSAENWRLLTKRKKGCCYSSRYITKITLVWNLNITKFLICDAISSHGVIAPLFIDYAMKLKAMWKVFLIRRLLTTVIVRPFSAIVALTFYAQTRNIKLPLSKRWHLSRIVYYESHMNHTWCI